MSENKSNKFVYLALFLFLSYFMSWWGGYMTDYFKEPWYSTLIKPSYTPPDWVFAPVWTTLYLFMTIAIWAAWHKNYKNINLVLIYFIHLCFNTTWSIVFFVFHNILFALINLLVIIFFIIVLILKYKDINKVSYYLMIPYLLWSCYALILNFSLLILN